MSKKCSYESFVRKVSDEDVYEGEADLCIHSYKKDISEYILYFLRYITREKLFPEDNPRLSLAIRKISEFKVWGQDTIDKVNSTLENSNEDYAKIIIRELKLMRRNVDGLIVNNMKWLLARDYIESIDVFENILDKLKSV